MRPWPARLCAETRITWGRRCNRRFYPEAEYQLVCRPCIDALMARLPWRRA